MNFRLSIILASNNGSTLKNCPESEMENFITPLHFKKSFYITQLFPTIELLSHTLHMTQKSSWATGSSVILGPIATAIKMSISVGHAVDLYCRFELEQQAETRFRYMGFCLGSWRWRVGVGELILFFVNHHRGILLMQ